MEMNFFVRTRPTVARRIVQIPMSGIVLAAGWNCTTVALAPPIEEPPPQYDPKARPRWEIWRPTCGETKPRS